METVRGLVNSVADGRVNILVAEPIRCARCAAGKGCGAGLRLAGNQPVEIDIDLPGGVVLRAGDAVELRIDSRYLLKAALLAYGLPLLSLLVFVGGASLGGVESDAVVVACGVAGLVSGLALGRRFLSASYPCREFVPEIVRPGAATAVDGP